MMGGELKVRSEPGRGSSFSFSLSFPRPTGESEALHRNAPLLSGLRVLAADDNERVLSAVRRCLEPIVGRVDLCASAEEALVMTRRAAAEQQPYDLLLMDWKLGGMNGIEGARRIREEEAISHQPRIVLVTGSDQRDVHAGAGAVEVDAEVAKPLTHSTLVDCLMDVVGGRGEGEEAGLVAAREPDLQDARVLLVEDNEINQQVAAEILRGFGTQVTVASSGEEALRQLQAAGADAFHLVLMDLQMPGMGGFRTTAAIREDPRLAGLPIVAVTADALPAVKQRCLDMGMAGFLPKPVNVQRLQQMIARWAGNSQSAGSPWNPGEPDAANPPASLDAEAGLERVGGNRALYLRLLGSFEERYSSAADRAREALDGEHREEARLLVHKLKGVAGNLGANGVQAAAAGLLRSLDTGDGQAEAGLQQLQAALRMAMSAFGTFRGEE